ncbi:MAG: glycosyltransferase [Pseudomonadota bacterium]|nr:glycosyltransferase [Pseudomonadota bacterium]
MSDARALSHTVVIPVYNKAPWIGETIASLAEQDTPPAELIVVDDASTDGSLAAARAALSAFSRACPHAHVELIESPVNLGPGGARNIGMQRANGSLLSFLDADDRYRPDCLRLVEERMRQHQLAMVVLGFDEGGSGCFPQLDLLAGELEPIEPGIWALPRPLRTAACPDFFMGRASNVVVRRCWIGSHRYHDSSRLNEGVDFWYRVLKTIHACPGTRVALMDEPLIAFRVLGDSLSHQPCHDWRRLEVPPTIRRYAASADRDDRRLMGMLGERWLEHAMHSLPTRRQKLAFVTRHLPLLARLSYYRRYSLPERA